MRLYKLSWLWVVVALATWGCYGEDGLPGPQGIPGPQGPQGPAGPASGIVYEVGVSLNADNNWIVQYEHPQNIEILNSDIVLAYTLEASPDDETAPNDVWRLMPITEFYPDGGTLLYNYDYSLEYIWLFLDASFPLSSLSGPVEFTARVVIIPADYATNARKSGINYENYYEVKKAFGLPEPKRIEGNSLKEMLKTRKQ